MFATGDHFRIHNATYLLAQVAVRQVCLINCDDGNRLKEAHRVADVNDISLSTFNIICGYNRFVKIEKVAIEPKMFVVSVDKCGSGCTVAVLAYVENDSVHLLQAVILKPGQYLAQEKKEEKPETYKIGDKFKTAMGTYFICVVGADRKIALVRSDMSGRKWYKEVNVKDLYKITKRELEPILCTSTFTKLENNNK